MHTELFHTVQTMHETFTTRLAHIEAQVAATDMLLHSLLVSHSNPQAALDEFAAAIDMAIANGASMTLATEWLHLLRNEFPKSKTEI